MILALPTAVEANLRQRYAEAHRAYHTWSHIENMVRQLDQAYPRIRDPRAARLAIVFHDAVYDPAANPGANEIASADLLIRTMVRPSDAVHVGRARQMILATIDHRIPEGLSLDLAQDCALFLDLDMSVLAAAPADYDAYAQGVAFEYVPIWGLERFRKGRADWLDTSLLRPSLFLTPAYQAREDAARANLRRELDGLRNR